MVSGGFTVFVGIPILLILNEYIWHNEVIGGLNIVNDWKFDFGSIIALIIIGIFGFIALSLSVIGFQYADATKVAWLEYSTIIFAFIYQIFLFEEIPNKFECIGIILVGIACSLSLIEELYFTFVIKKKAQRVLDDELDYNQHNIINHHVTNILDPSDPSDRSI